MLERVGPLKRQGTSSLGLWRKLMRFSFCIIRRDAFGSKSQTSMHSRPTHFLWYGSGRAASIMQWKQLNNRSVILRYYAEYGPMTIDARSFGVPQNDNWVF